MVDDVIHDPGGSLGNAFFQRSVRQQVGGHAIQEEMAHDFIRTGIALPVILAVRRPVPFAAIGHGFAFANVRPRREAAFSGHLLQEQHGLGRPGGVRQSLGRARHHVAEAFRRGVYGGPQAIVVVVPHLVCRNIACDPQIRWGHQTMPVMPRVHALFKQRRLRRQRHGAQFNVRHAGLRAHPHTGGLVGGELLHFIVRQISFSGEILMAIARRRLGVDARHAAGRAGPRGPVGCYRADRCTGLFQRRGNPRVVERVEGSKLLRLRRQPDRFGSLADRRDGQQARQPAGPGGPAETRESAPATLQHPHGFFKYLSNQFNSSHNTCSMDSRPP